MVQGRLKLPHDKVLRRIFDECVKDPIFHSRNLLLASQRLERKRGWWRKAKRKHLKK
jgi:hypothetical protein